MSKRVIPLSDHRTLEHSTFERSLIERALAASELDGPLVDTLGRPLHDLRVSVTDRCNFRCAYCMPKEVFDKTYRFLPHQALLSFEEIARLARSFVALGVRKIRLTGGEPLLRKDLPTLVRLLAELRTPEGAPPELTLTTNGSLLARKAAELKQAGLDRVTVSLDALDDATFKAMNDVDFPVASVLEGIEEAQRVGLSPLKVNMVVKRGTNDSEILPMARHFRGTGVELRFIEYMDVGSTNNWRMDEVMPTRAVIERLQQEFDLEPLPRQHASDTSERWQHRDGSGKLGFISSVTRAFCGACSRARLSTEGKLFLCLFASQGYDLRSMLRGDATDRDIEAAIRSVWAGRTDRYSELRSSASDASGLSRESGERKVEMHYIGG